ncbi:hypothetical protein MUO71_02925 [Candidatus Bathyarchaeota archaeon]|nr:hypothetical protein [Candidatus Bathyarchaeota archaeon]
MKKSDSKSLRFQIISIVTLPLIIIFWMMGWILYCIGSQKTSPITTRKGQLILQKIAQQENFEREIIEPQILA